MADAMGSKILGRPCRIEMCNSKRTCGDSTFYQDSLANKILGHWLVSRVDGSPISVPEVRGLIQGMGHARVTLASNRLLDAYDAPFGVKVAFHKWVENRDLSAVRIALPTSSSDRSYSGTV